MSTYFGRDVVISADLCYNVIIRIYTDLAPFSRIAK